MARKVGDSNYSAREMRLIAEKKAVQAQAKATQAKVLVKDARIRELKEKLKGK